MKVKLRALVEIPYFEYLLQKFLLYSNDIDFHDDTNSGQFYHDEEFTNNIYTFRVDEESDIIERLFE